MILLISFTAMLIVILAFFVVINLNFRTAYTLYSIPKVHYLVKYLCIRDKDYLKTSQMALPVPIHAVIDDLGWKKGADLRKEGGPSRLIVNRDPSIEEYKELVSISEQTGCRLLGLFVISELDMENVCAKPEYNRPIKKSDITEFGTAWDNTKNMTDENYEIMEYIKQHSANIEFGLHGVRHEHFDENGMSNAEWADRVNGNSWGVDNTNVHCEVFEQIIRHYYTEKQLKFPHAFVPPSHSFNRYDIKSIEALKSFGIKYMCSCCMDMPGMIPLQMSGSFEHGILMLDRKEACVPERVNYAPRRIPEGYTMIGTHFPNYWGAENKWSLFFKKVRRSPYHVTGKNIEYTYSQWIYDHNTSLRNRGVEKILINNKYMPDWAYENDFLNGIVLKIHLHNSLHVSYIEGEEIVLLDYYEDEFDNAYITLGDVKNNRSALGKKMYEVGYKIGKSSPTVPHFIREMQTYNINYLRFDQDKVEAGIRIFGKHRVKVYTGFDNAELVVKESDVKIDNFSITNKEIIFETDCDEMLGKDVSFIIKKE